VRALPRDQLTEAHQRRSRAPLAGYRRRSKHGGTPATPLRTHGTLWDFDPWRGTFHCGCWSDNTAATEMVSLPVEWRARLGSWKRKRLEKLGLLRSLAQLPRRTAGKHECTKSLWAAAMRPMSNSRKPIGRTAPCMLGCFDVLPNSPSTVWPFATRARLPYSGPD